jgi:hypothetical protein
VCVFEWLNGCVVGRRYEPDDAALGDDDAPSRK